MAAGPALTGMTISARRLLHLLIYPLTLGAGKRLAPAGFHREFTLMSATPFPTGVVALHYAL